MFIWPENIIPLPSFSFNVTNESSVIRKKMESGRFRQRKRFTDEVETAKVVFELTNDEYASFKSAWTFGLKSGSDFFLINIPTGDGQLLTQAEVRFTDDYTSRHLANGNWRVSSSIEYKESSKISEIVLDALTFLGYDEVPQFEIDAQGLEDEINHFPAQHPWIII